MRLALTALALPALLTACAPEPEADTGALAEAFQEASKQYDVPRDLLVSLSFSLTRLDGRDGAANKESGYGVMNLVEGNEGPDLLLAADLLNVEPDLLRKDERLNILGAAALLRYYADLREAGTGEPLEFIGDWYPVVAEYSGSQEPTLRASYARQVYRFIEGGLDAETPDGGRLTIESREVWLDDDDSMLFSTASDYSGAAQFSGAHSSNYSNYSRGAGDIDRIVIHTVQGSYSGCISWFGNSSANASAHYVVRSSDGEVTQMVREEDVAWHAGNWDTNARSVGIEHEGYISQPGTWYTEAMYRESARLTRDIADRNGIPLDRSHIIGHYEVPGCSSGSGGGASCHTDPGSGWDWDYFMDLVRGTSSGGSGGGGATQPTAATGDLVGYVREGDVYDSGAGISGATVSLSTGEVTTTDGSGLYRFEDVVADHLQVTAEASGYASLTDTKTVQADMTNWKSIALTPVSAGGGSSGGGGSSSGGGGAMPDAPVNITPWNYQTINTSSVTMAWDGRGGVADYYEVEIFYWTGDEWAYYYTYEPREESKQFWPQVSDTYYAFGVRGHNGYGSSDWSDWGSFTFTY
ncbi:MAG: N-acetylmuramoyl-L-alanine amidase [Alphaproteobacteria bacterium]|nr:N-acetylmuramoyl-L-alanine amidase [Alphaproteobacteria bacterium]